MSSKSNNSTNDVSGVAEGAAGDVDAVDGTAAAASATTMLASNRPSYPITGANSAGKFSYKRKTFGMHPHHKTYTSQFEFHFASPCI